MITEYTIDQSKEWDAVVHSFKRFDTYWLNGYAKSLKIHGDGEPLLVYYEKESTRGMIVVIKRDIANHEAFHGIIEKLKYYDLTTPYGYGGWIIEGNETRNLFDEYTCWVGDNNIISEFVRFHPILKNYKQCKDFYSVIKMGQVVYMDLKSPELIWENLTSKNRNVIRKALKNDVKIFNGRFPDIYERFRIIYNRTMEKDNAEDYYYFEPEYYDSILYDMEQNAQVFYAVKDAEVIAASIVLASNGMMNYHLSGSLKEYNSLAATNLLLYKAALWGNANGYKTFYLGGGLGSNEDNLFKFKKAFNRNAHSYYYIGKKIYSQEKYTKLLSMRRITNEGFFPAYRG